MTEVDVDPSLETGRWQGQGVEAGEGRAGRSNDDSVTIPEGEASDSGDPLVPSLYPPVFPLNQGGSWCGVDRGGLRQQFCQFPQGLFPFSQDHGVNRGASGQYFPAAVSGMGAAEDDDAGGIQLFGQFRQADGIMPVVGHDRDAEKVGLFRGENLPDFGGREPDEVGGLGRETGVPQHGDQGTDADGEEREERVVTA